MHAKHIKRIPDESQQERERVLGLIEKDRQARNAERCTEATFVHHQRDARDMTSREPSSIEGIESRPPGSQMPDVCALQFRLFDGSTLRSKFPSTATLLSDVRPWIDETRSDGDAPYNFKKVLRGQVVTISEEQETLKDIGLTPNATLILIPVRGFSSAYGNNSGTSSFGFVSNKLTTIGNIWGWLFARGEPPTADESHENAIPIVRGTGRATNIRTLESRTNPSEDRQLYNGNHVCESMLVCVF